MRKVLSAATVILLIELVNVAATNYTDPDELEELEQGQTAYLEGGLNVTITKKLKKCFKRAVVGDILTIDYVGTYNNGTVFDESKTKLTQFRFQLGGGRIIQGLELGVRGMCKGETRLLSVPHKLLSNGRGVASKSGEDLNYRVKLLSIDDKHVGYIRSNEL